jgi:hypothetical protein
VSVLSRTPTKYPRHFSDSPAFAEDLSKSPPRIGPWLLVLLVSLPLTQRYLCLGHSALTLRVIIAGDGNRGSRSRSLRSRSRKTRVTSTRSFEISRATLTFKRRLYLTQIRTHGFIDPGTGGRKCGLQGRGSRRPGSEPHEKSSLRRCSER